MDPRFEPHNSHWAGAREFVRRDPHLQRLKRCPLVYESPLLDRLPLNLPGVFALYGGRQVGKSTLLKQAILRLIRQAEVPPQRVCYLTGELLDDHHALLRVLSDFLEGVESSAGPVTGLSYLFLDEITYVSGWDKAVKFLADTGALEQVVVVVTGSDALLIEDAMKRLPGRRGRADEVDFHYFPLSFREVVSLRKSVPRAWVDEAVSLPLDTLTDALLARHLPALMTAFREYHVTGGFLTALNDWESHGAIAKATFRIYADWVRGDLLKQGKSDHYLREVLTGVLKRYTTPASWNALAKELSIDHPSTVADYCTLLQRIDALFIQPALAEHTLSAAPKKAKKLFFADPFIHHALRAFVEETADPQNELLAPLLEHDPLLAPLVEASLVTHARRRFPSFYVKAEGEVDLAYVTAGTFHPVEVKWTEQLRPKDLKQIRKYPNGIIAARTSHLSRLEDTLVVPLPVMLLRLS